MEDKKNWVKELLSYVIIIGIVLIIKFFVITTVVVNGTSMNDTLHNKDIMLLDEISMRFSNFKRFDIIVIKTNRNKIIKRVIALPGETVECINNVIYVNGKELKENYGKGITEDFDKVVVGKNEYFVLGDNREHSLDSRIIGKISKKDIMGRAFFIIFPFNRIGIK